MKIFRRFPEPEELQDGYIEVDIESNGLNPFKPDAKIHCMAISQDGENIFWTRIRKEDYPKYIKLFERHPIICRRGTFEGSWIKTIFGIQPRLHFDTKVGASLIDENEPTGLKDEAVEHLGVPYWDDVEEFKVVKDWVQMSRYNSRDVGYDYRLYKTRHIPHLKKHPKQARLARYIIMPAVEVFTDVICKGFHIDEAEAIRKLDICREKKKEFNDRIDVHAGYHINPNSPKQMVKFLYEELGLKCPVLTAKGAKSSSEAALIRLVGKHQVIDDIMEWRKWQKYDSTYLTPWVRKGPILHANYGFTDTDTGRLNSTMVKDKRGEKNLGATIHQCPRDPFVRNLITSRDPGSVIVAADLSQAELRLVAHASNEPTMIGIFNTGSDMDHIRKYHNKTLNPKTYRGDKCTECDIHYATAGTLTTEEIDKETRKKAKAVNFGFVYGMWAKKFVKYAKEKFGLDLSQREGDLYREAFFDKYEGLLLWHSRVEAVVSQTGFIDSVFGRRRHLPSALWGSGLEDWIRREAVRQGINSPIQSAGSDLNLFIAALMSSLTRLKWSFKIDPAKAFMVASAHDSQIYECKRDYVKTLREGIKYTVANLPLKEYFNFEFKVPILMDVNAYEDCWEGKEFIV